MNAKAVWKIKEKFPVWSGTVVTAGDVVFYGTMDGWFKAVDARNRRSRCGSSRPAPGIIGQPVTYKGPDGKQYVADPVWRRRMGRRDRLRRSRSARRHSGARLRECHGRICQAHDPGGNAVRFCAAVAYATADPKLTCAISVAACHSWCRRQSAQPNRKCCASVPIRTTCRFQINRAEGFENKLAELYASDLHARMPYTSGGRNASDFVRETRVLRVNATGSRVP